jgi:hypothetical protein
MANLCDDDIVLWSERQAELLRQHAATARVNGSIDWADIIEEDAEARVFRANAANRFAPLMRQRIGLPRLYRQAVRGLPSTIDRQPPLPVPAVCAWTLDQLLSEDDAAA